MCKEYILNIKTRINRKFILVFYKKNIDIVPKMVYYINISNIILNTEQYLEGELKCHI